MLCRNCNYILSGEEAFCPHCGQAVKTQEVEKEATENKDIPLNVNESPPSKKKGSIFEEESFESPVNEDEKTESKKSKGAIAVISMFVLILVAVAVFTSLEYFDLAPAIASFISEKTSSPDNTPVVTTSSAELSGSEGMIAPEINYKPALYTVSSQKSLPLRKGPDDTYAPVGYVPPGTKLQITGGCLLNDIWVYVYIPSEDAYGWLNASYLMQDSVPLSTTLPAEEEEETTAKADGTTKRTEESQTAAPQSRTAKITAEKGLYLRVGPGVDFEAVTVIGKDEEVTLIEVCQSNPSWIYVQFGKDKGYVSRSYITEL